MQPHAKIHALIELVTAVEAGDRPADDLTRAYFASRRYAGSKDRAEVIERLYALGRRRGELAERLSASGGSVTPRTLVVALLRHLGTPAEVIEQAYCGAVHAPAPLSELERRALSVDPAQSVSRAARLGVPSWFLDELCANGVEEVDALCQALQNEAPMDLRVNVAATTRKAFIERLRALDVAAELTPWSPWGVRLRSRRPLPPELTRAGLFEPQDEASQLVALAVDVQPGHRVLDLCAGAGGKTLAMAAVLGGQGQVVATDVSAGRLEHLVPRLRAAGASNVTLRAIEGIGDPWLVGQRGTFDRVLVDAPCSGTGTWRRHPDARWRLRSEDIADQVHTQFELLSAAVSLARPGGHVIYATCSVLPRENEHVVAAVLASATHLRRVRAAVPAALHRDDGSVALRPDRHATDGFYLAVLERES